MLKVFECLCYASTHLANRNKFQPRARRGVFLGLQIGMKGYIILDIDNREIFVSRDILFDEFQFLFLKQPQLQPKTFSRPIGPLYFPNRHIHEEKPQPWPTLTQSRDLSADFSLESTQKEQPYTPASPPSERSLVPLSYSHSLVSPDSSSSLQQPTLPHRSSRPTRLS